VTPTFGDEANIAYVGFTRAIRRLHLPRTSRTSSPRSGRRP
jgi:hypothetical protein